MSTNLPEQGEYRGDFTRDTHDPAKRFSRVLLQQGRVLLDADWNEQTSILLRYLRTLAADLIGEHGGPEGAFNITKLTGGSDFGIGEGHYYVGGILCENEYPLGSNGSPVPVTYRNQSDYTPTEENFPPTPCVVYLDVWERHVSHLEDTSKNNDNPGIREVALGGADTATRAKVIWQVKVAKTTETVAANIKGMTSAEFLVGLGELARPGTGRLRAQAKKAAASSDECPCNISPESRYRGVENQLYRVEVHRPGGAWNSDPNTKKGAATFKWSRENGSVAFPIHSPVSTGSNGFTVKVGNLGKDARHTLAKGDWVELTDDDHTLQGRPGPLFQVDNVVPEDKSVILAGTLSDTISADKHPLLRRWDHKAGDARTGGLELVDGAAVLRQSSSDNDWLNLEKGVQVQFPKDTAARYATGDYWLIPARVATGDVEWPGTVSDPAWMPAHGVQHYYAPLALLNSNGNFSPCRREFIKLTK